MCMYRLDTNTETNTTRNRPAHKTSNYLPSYEMVDTRGHTRRFEVAHDILASFCGWKVHGVFAIRVGVNESLAQ